MYIVYDLYMYVMFSFPCHDFYLSMYSYSAVAFCDVTGRENRLPLKVKGTGKGPQLKFSFDTLDIQNIFVNSAHAYEVSPMHYSRLRTCTCIVIYFY